MVQKHPITSLKMIRLLWIIVFVCIASRPSLVWADELQLDQGWKITNSNESIRLSNQLLPSGIYSALEEANLTESVLHSFNDVALRWIAHETWTYSLEFNVAESLAGSLKCSLVFHGLDTVANIQLNGHVLGPPFAQNMFVRYQYDVCDMLDFKAPNTLSVQFVPPALAAKLEASKHLTTPPECPPKPYNGECHMNFLRKMQASFAWDWGLAAPSVGIWKPVTLEFYQSAIIRDVTYRLEEDIEGSTWLVAVTVFLETSGTIVKGYLSMELVGLSSLKWIVECKPSGHAECVQSQSFRVPKESVETWWPNGLGSQSLYDLNVFWEGIVPAESGSSSKTVRIGFRTIELVEEPAENDGLTFYLRVNHVAVFMKGSNWIPSHILPERANNQKTIRRLLTDVRDAHMNMLRVWGGGIYESDEFYSMADELGILIWQDMMFACAMYPAYPAFLKSVATEIKQNVRRIQSHPSIALWAGNNENEVALRSNWYGTSTEMQRFSSEYIQLYDDTIRRVVAENDDWHLWLYSSPSNGQIQANQSIIQDDPQDSNFGDIHYYNYVLDGWNPNIYPHPRFASEYGFQSFPSLNAWRSVLSDNDSFTQLLDHRQHFPFASIPVKLLINRHLLLPPESSRRYDAALVYFSQLSQAMTTRAESEVYRIKRGSVAQTMGALYWQLNDVWVAPSWSSIEYNGNFKILHHWASEFFAPLAVIAHVRENDQVEVYVINDHLEALDNLQVRMEVFRWSSLQPCFKNSINITMSANAVQMVNHFHIDTHIKPPNTRQNSILRFQLLSANGTVVSTSHLLPISLKRTVEVVPRPGVRISIISHTCTENQSVVQLKLDVQFPAIFVYITLNHEVIKEYRLSQNGFMQLDSMAELRLTYFNLGCILPVVEAKNFRVQTVNRFKN